jgi:hypothetical protein
MNVCGRAIAIFDCPSDPSAMRDSADFVSNSARARFASAFATRKPTLWRVVAYPSPGFPSPTTSRSTRGAAPPANSFVIRSSPSLL